MSARTRGRILVALDASTSSREAAAAAAEMAGWIGADLEGLFVEDENLLRLAGFPFARQLRVPEGRLQAFDARSIEAELRAVAARAREELAQAAAPRRITWTFRVVRGAVSREVLEAAGGADLLALGSTGHRARREPGATARAAAERGPTLVLLVAGSARPGRPIAVAYKGSPAAARALDAAARFAAAAGRDLVLLLLAPDRRAADALAEVARRALGRESPLPTRWAGGSTPGSLVAAARAARPSILVVAPGSELLEEGWLAQLLDAAGCPVLLAR